MYFSYYDFKFLSWKLFSWKFKNHQDTSRVISQTDNSIHQIGL